MVGRSPKRHARATPADPTSISKATNRRPHSASASRGASGSASRQLSRADLVTSRDYLDAGSSHVRTPDFMTGLPALAVLSAGTRSFNRPRVSLHTGPKNTDPAVASPTTHERPRPSR